MAEKIPFVDAFPIRKKRGISADRGVNEPSRKLTAGGPQHDALEKVTGPFKYGNFWYL